MFQILKHQFLKIYNNFIEAYPGQGIFPGKNINMKWSPGKTYKLHFFNSANERQNHQILLLLNTILEFRGFQNSENKPLQM